MLEMIVLLMKQFSVKTLNLGLNSSASVVMEDSLKRKSMNLQTRERKQANYLTNPGSSKPEAELG